MLKAIYTFISYICSPLVFVYLVVRGIKDPAYRERRKERFGFVSNAIAKDSVWFHAVSAGETIAAVPLIESLLNRNANLKVLVTTTTPTGSAEVFRHLGERVDHCYAPYDLPWSVRMFLRRVRPKILFILETELWPNLIGLTRKSGVAVYLINARLSQQSALGYSRVKSLTSTTLNSISGIACQYEATAARFEQLGIPSHKLHLTGNMKFDVGYPPMLPESIQNQVQIQRSQREYVWIAGSTHPGEEEVVLAAHQVIQQTLGKSLLILAPRHTDRSGEIVELCDCFQLSATTLGFSSEKNDVLVVDQMGVLFSLYGFADLAFIGGSLEGTGGHNPIEAACHGMPILMGPSRHNFEEVTNKFVESECLHEVHNHESLSSTVLNLFQDPDECERQSSVSKEVVERNRGALARLESLVDQWVTDSRREN